MQYRNDTHDVRVKLSDSCGDKEKNGEGKQKIHDDILWIYLLNIDFLLAFCENSGILCWKDWKKYLGDSKELRTK